MRAIVLLAICLCHFRFTTAQTPTPVYGASQAVVQGKAMIISGGTPGETTISLGAVSQTFSLDLTVAWDTANPKYNKLQGGPADIYVPSSRTGDDTLVVVSTGQIFSFNLSGSQTWIPGSTLTNGIAAKGTRLGGAIDPATNTFYLPGGYYQAGVINNTMMAYNLAYGTATSLPMPSDLPSDIEAGVAWSAYAKRLFLHAGRVSASSILPLGVFYSFNPADNTWIQPPVGGDIPPSRDNHCMVSDATGSRLVVFGGLNQLVQPALSDIYVLDVASMQWKKGPDAGSSVSRAAPSCGIDHDFFIVWGGGYGNTALTNNVTLLFNLQSMQWVHQFVPATPLVTAGGGTSPSGGTSPGNLSTSSNGAMIGGVVGGVAAIALIVGFFVYRRRKTRAAFLNKKGEEDMHHRTEGYVPPPPSVPQHLNEHYHDRRSYQSVPTTSQQRLSPQLWVGKDGEPPQTGSYYLSASKEPLQRLSPQLYVGSDGGPLQTSSYYLSASKEQLQRAAPQCYEAAAKGLTQSDAPVNGPHAVIS
ncbi:hypothetical protein BGZ83_007386 [Gryganskiella cystojenkinii]|nr:hypothetical protein BGZ83_007386 [Gryganskiella cystojenkinii]